MRRHHPDPVVAGVGDHQVAGAVHCGPARGMREALAAEPPSPSGPVTLVPAGVVSPVGPRIHHPHRPAVGDVQAAVGERHAARERKDNPGGPGRAADPPATVEITPAARPARGTPAPAGRAAAAAGPPQASAAATSAAAVEASAPRLSPPIPANRLVPIGNVLHSPLQAAQAAEDNNTKASSI